MDVKNIAVNVSRINTNTYQLLIYYSFSILNNTPAKFEKLLIWHFWWAHLNFITLFNKLYKLQMDFLDNTFDNFICRLCELLKVFKQYNLFFWYILNMKYTKIYIDFDKSITPQKFLEEKYFFKFTNWAIQKN